MKASLSAPATVRDSRILRRLGGSSRRLLLSTVLTLAAFGAGAGVWAWTGAPAASESSGGTTSAGAGAEDSELQIGWTNAVEECDCLFGGQ